MKRTDETDETELDVTGPGGPHFETPVEGADLEGVEAWEEVSPGRFMPRRIRGSCQGRALG